jgi:hypothetical protein
VTSNKKAGCPGYLGKPAFYNLGNKLSFQFTIHELKFMGVLPEIRYFVRVQGRLKF